MVTTATLTRHAIPPPHDPHGPWLMRLELDDGRLLIVEWRSMRDATPRADEVADALDESGWVLAGPLLQVSPGVWSLDLLPV